MNHKNPILEIDFNKPGAAKKCRLLVEMPSGISPFAIQVVDRKRVSQQAFRDHRYGKTYFEGSQVSALIVAEIFEGRSSIITRKGLKMTEQVAVATEALQAAMIVFTEQAENFNGVTDKIVGQAKQRVSQLTDYNNRLATALNNLNKTLGDERMLRALENAERIVGAMTLLDKLEQNGSLAKIMAALAPSK